ncbi:hypothetical protein P154DRAFT_258147 [Amniculicola lignicola CBS 123094]|uniref:Uncharacterized protein n=1 Tax=Amniculicola lignicola CBS 123094 TaxID=1392246 RepID=A0A6A5WXE5_9PLEO|nr:hypothetical protein P154DRAFT_258147 [Amniculicola lignicola CBS 123094]
MTHLRPARPFLCCTSQSGRWGVSSPEHPPLSAAWPVGALRGGSDWRPLAAIGVISPAPPSPYQIFQGEHIDVSGASQDMQDMQDMQDKLLFSKRPKQPVPPVYKSLKTRHDRRELRNIGECRYGGETGACWEDVEWCRVPVPATLAEREILCRVVMKKPCAPVHATARPKYMYVTITSPGWRAACRPTRPACRGP